MRHLCWLLFAGILAGCLAVPVQPAGDGSEVLPAGLLKTLSPVPPAMADPTNRFAEDLRAAQLGHRLYFDKSLSRNGQVACATCHQPEHAFADQSPTGVGLETGTRNTPSLLHAASERWQGWGGKADSVWLQSLNALEDPKEQGAKRLAVVNRLRITYQAPYESVFGPLPPAGLPNDGHPGEPAFDTLSPDRQEQVNRAVVNVGKSLGAFVRRLVPGPAPFDRFVAGDTAAISLQAKQGLALFVGKSGCIACHSGPRFSDGEFHNVGVPSNRTLPEDTGRLADVVTLLANPRNGESRWSDAPSSFPLAGYGPDAALRGQFKTPSLRNVAVTAPYWHNGAGGNALESVIAFEVAGGGQGVGTPFGGIIDAKLVPHPVVYAESQALRAFLETLTDGPVPAPWDTMPGP